MIDVRTMVKERGKKKMVVSLLIRGMIRGSTTDGSNENKLSKQERENNQPLAQQESEQPPTGVTAPPSEPTHHRGWYRRCRNHCRRNHQIDASSLWRYMFSSMLGSSATTEVILDGGKNNALQLMQAEIQLISPSVPARVMKFFRFSRQQAEGVWAVVDLSFDVFDKMSRRTMMKCAFAETSERVILPRGQHERKKEIDFSRDVCVSYLGVFLVRLFITAFLDVALFFLWLFVGLGVVICSFVLLSKSFCLLVVIQVPGLFCPMAVRGLFWPLFLVLVFGMSCWCCLEVGLLGFAATFVFFCWSWWLLGFLDDFALLGWMLFVAAAVGFLIVSFWRRFVWLGCCSVVIWVRVVSLGFWTILPFWVGYSLCMLLWVVVGSFWSCFVWLGCCSVIPRVLVVWIGSAAAGCFQTEILGLGWFLVSVVPLGFCLAAFLNRLLHFIVDIVNFMKAATEPPTQACCS
ncbi:hypothetical protein LXL04_009094 [Taraxacum kok-saghyz]